MFLTNYHIPMIMTYFNFEKFVTLAFHAMIIVIDFLIIPETFLALHGHTEVLDYLLEKCHYGADIKDSCGSTPFMDAVRVQDIQAAKLLISKHMVRKKSAIIAFLA